MAAPKNNEFWKLRSKHGRKALFTNPKKLWEAACEYFQWCEDNPLWEAKAFQNKGEVIIAELPKMRAMTLGQLCFYLNCTKDYFHQFKESKTYKENKDFSIIIKEIENIIYNQKFQGAAADLLNSNIIARDLGLIEKRQSEVNLNGTKFQVKLINDRS